MSQPIDPLDIDKLTSLCKRRGFIFQSSEIYGGLSSTWDYGPLGVELKRNIKDSWWKTMVWERDDMVGLDAAIDTGVIDPDNVGLHGHSWGGYQTSFLVTQTDKFAAAVAGAPLTNMISMYSSIYWNSGGGNMAIFESSQGRFTGDYLEATDAYIRNSPVFFADRVQTPLIILHNDQDGAVDWNQGIEYYNTLRRLGKDVVMLQYVGENHGLRVPANQKDFTVRMREFFDHHLKGADAPAWLLEGVPHLKMDAHLEERAPLVAPKRDDKGSSRNRRNEGH